MVQGRSVAIIDGKRVILDEDGKPCRSCNSLLDFRFATAKMDTKPKTTTNSDSTSNAGLGVAAVGLAAGASALKKKDEIEPATPSIPNDCPPDVAVLGRSAWTLLHTMAAQYPEKPSDDQKKDMTTFIDTFSRVYPCWYCAEDFQKWIKKSDNAPKLDSREDLSRWMCKAHNEVNQKLGKPAFDCNLWKYRWKDGWPDGRCD